MSSESPHRFRLETIDADLPPDRIEAIGERFQQVAAAAAINSTLGRRSRRLQHIGNVRPSLKSKKYIRKDNI